MKTTERLKYEAALLLFSEGGKIQTVRRAFASDQSRTLWIQKELERGTVFQIQTIRDLEGR